MRLKTWMIYSIFLSLPTDTAAQPAQQAAFVTELANKVKSNPENPLQINSQTLAEFAEKLPDGQLKYKLLNYSTRLGSDDGLGTRQVYWDINEALNRHPTLASSARYQEMRQSLDLLFNQSDLVVRALKGDLKGIKATDFLNDPAFSTALNKVTGSPNTSMGLAMSISGITDLIASINETKKWKQDYQSLAEISKHTVNTEIDEKLAPALMQSYVGRTFSIVGPNYRYDFRNGNSLMVDNNILLLTDRSNKVLRTLCRVGEPNNGIYKGAKESPTARVVIDPDERYFMVGSYIASADKKYQCKTCETPGGKNYLLDASTGATIRQFREGWDTRVTFLDNGFESWVPTSHAGWEWGRAVFPYNDGKPEKPKSAFVPGGDAAVFNINGTQMKWKKAAEEMKLSIAGPFQLGLMIGSDGASASALSEILDPSNPKRQSIYYMSSFLQLSHQGQMAPPRFVNGITGITADRQGTIFVVGANGSISRISAAEHGSAESLYSAVEKGLRGPSLVASYDFTEPQEARVFDAQSNASPTEFYEFPQLQFTPDETQLVYIMRDELFLINTRNVSQVRRFKLSFKPSYLQFARENGAATLLLYGENDFAFPICKKYSLQVLNAPERMRAPVSGATPNQPAKSESEKSIPDEIAKLKKLLDQGVISKQEFEQGKKRILAGSKN